MTRAQHFRLAWALWTIGLNALVLFVALYRDLDFVVALSGWIFANGLAMIFALDASAFFRRR